MGEGMKQTVILTKQTVLACTLLLFGVLFFVPLTSFAASYSLSPASGSYAVGKTFPVRVQLNAGSDAVNTGDATISYDSQKLTAVSVSKDGSPFNLWVTEPSVGGGNVTFAGGGTSPITGSQTVVTITFKAKAEGSASVDFTNASLLAGAGQDVLSGSTGGTYTITPASSEPEPEPTTPEPKEERNVKIPPPEAPTINSSTHPEQDGWYSKSEVKVAWDIPYGVLGVRVGFDDDQNSTTTETHEPPISDWSKKGVDDGVWFFHATYKNRGGWGSSTSYRIQVDTTPPEPFEVTAVGGDLTAELRFEATDALSGILVYRVSVDGGRARDVQPSELVSGGYKIANLDPGDHTLSVTAVDLAENERSVEAPVTVTGTKVTEDDEEVQTSGFGAIYWVSILFMAALAIVITMLVQERRKYQEEKDRIKRETMEVGERLINIFGVLRDEIEEKVTELSHKPNMTDNERNILEGLKDALDISEELIDKEVEDVRKLLK